MAKDRVNTRYQLLGENKPTASFLGILEDDRRKGLHFLEDPKLPKNQIWPGKKVSCSVISSGILQHIKSFSSSSCTMILNDMAVKIDALVRFDQRSRIMSSLLNLKSGSHLRLGGVWPHMSQIPARETANFIGM